MTWDEYAATWDEQPGVQQYAQAAFDSLVALAETSGFEITGTWACDFGCGTGLLTQHLVGLCDRIDVVDSSPAMLDVLRAKAEIHGWDTVRVFDQLPVSHGRYDLVVCSSVCAFVDDYPGLVHELVSSIKAGGLFVQWDWELDPSDDEPFGLARDAVRQALNAAGLVSVSVDSGFEVSADGRTMKPLIGAGHKPR